MAWILSKLGLPEWAVWLALLVAIVGGVLGYGAYEYHTGYVKGSKETQARYEVAISAYKVALQKREDAAKYYENWLVQTNKFDLAMLKAQLDDARSKVQIKVRTIIQKVPQYVTAQADAHCTITRGAVSVFDSAIDSDPTAAPASVPASGPVDVDAPAGVTLSHVATITATNLGECVERGQVIGAWQNWYNKNKANWDEYRAKLSEKTPELSLNSTP